MSNMQMRALAPALLLMSACVHSTSEPAPAATPDIGAPAIAPAVRWYRASAEKRALYLEIYRDAAASLLRKGEGRTRQSFAVILDADETVLDNSRYELEHPKYEPSSWNDWVQSERAEALPGAVGFTQQVHAVGGRVVIVTNRDDKYCDATRSNLQKVGIVADEVLCRTDPNTDDKNPRFEAVERGTAPSVLPALHVIMWVGDNIQDFPHLAQAIRQEGDAAFSHFGDTYIVLPNPMYGSWEKNSLP